MSQHVGSTPRSGHYFTWVRVADGFFVFDDGTVRYYAQDELPFSTHENASLLAYSLRPLIHAVMAAPTPRSLVTQFVGKGTRRQLRALTKEDVFMLRSSPGIEKADSSSGDDIDEDAPDSDADFPNEPDLDDGVYLSPEADALALLDGHVESLLNVFAKNENVTDCRAYLQSSPNVAPVVTRLGPRTALGRFRTALAQVRDCHTHSSDAIRLAVPYWECHNYRICVLVEAVGRCWGLPPVFYLDSFRSAMFSLMHKEACVSTSGFQTKHRPWTCGVGDTGTGKSHPTDQTSGLTKEVCTEEPTYSVGNKEDNFHVLLTRTYAALEDKMKDTEGYALLLCGEGSQQLCKSHPSKGEWTDGGGLVFDRMMDAATGKQFGGETKHDREKRKSAKKHGDIARSPYHKDTNLGIVLLIQDSVFVDWWALAESKVHEGLAARFLFSFARGRQVGPLRFKNFFNVVYRPIIKDILRSVLVTFSPKNPMMHSSGACGVYEFTHANERFFKNVRVACKAIESDDLTFRRKFIAGVNKCGYWVPLVAWETAMLAEITDYVLKAELVKAGREPAGTTPPLKCTSEINFSDLACAMNFMWSRYAFGQVCELIVI